VLPKPPPDVRFVRFGDSSLDFELLVWIDSPQHDDDVSSALRYAIRTAFAAEGIEIPFPRREVTVRAVPASG
jgi:small-conductance mechanosensitive channel